MILKGKQRSGAANLAQHLLKEENEHVEVAELRHFTSENLLGALNEIEASARPTRCKQPLYSCSFNPPETAHVSTEAFFAAIDRLEKRLGLTDQPRAVVFHEKEGGRRHCHVVWSRITLDGEKLKAIPMPYDRSRMKSLSRELFLENIDNGWVMPNGLMEGQQGLRSNFTLAEWQQAMRANKDPREIKAAITECMAASDSQAAFAAALDAKGYKLAKGDRRGFVAVDMQGEVYAIARYTSTKEINARLGSCDTLPTVADRKQEFAAQASTHFDQLRGQADKVFEKQLAQAEKLLADVVTRQRDERAKLKDAHKERWDRETVLRQNRFRKGLRGLIDRLSGERRKIEERNTEEMRLAYLRDRKELDAVIFRQQDQSRAIHLKIEAMRDGHTERTRQLSYDGTRAAVKHGHKYKRNLELGR